MDHSVNPLRAFRAKAGLSQDRFADALEEVGALRPSKATISRIETGKQPLPVELLPFAAKVTGLSKRKLRPDLAALLNEKTLLKNTAGAA